MRRIRSRRGVLEGLPLTLLISVIIVVIGTGILMAFFYYSQSSQLSSLSVERGSAHKAVNGWLPAWSSPMQFLVSTSSQAHGGLGGVTVQVNGSGIDVIEKTGNNGTAFFVLPLPLLPQHATSGTLIVIASYHPSATWGQPQTETLSVSEVIIG